MGEIIYLRDQHFEDFHDKCLLILSASSHIELFRQLTKALHHMLVVKNTPVVLYQYLNTGKLRLVYYFPLGASIEHEGEITSISSLQELSNSKLTYYELNGEHEIWGYVAHAPSSYVGATCWVSSIINTAAHQLHLISTKCIGRQHAKLKTFRRLLTRDIHHFTSIEQILERHHQGWCDIFHARGICLAYQDTLHCFGHCPSHHQLFKQLSLLANNTEADVIELGGNHQGSLAIKLGVASTHHGWLFLFRAQPFIDKNIDSATHRSLSCWLAYEACIALILADDLAITIAALEISHANRQFITTAQQLASLPPVSHSAPRLAASGWHDKK
ncbi:MAG: hypothetical protein KA748_15305 [Halomonas sp.]|nr:hypothetical protein [Halomonas sp.]MBP5981558.1 hypothetical protein [Halomonas sp.]